MRRETLVFTIAGTLFGLVVGYMAASWDAVPRPAAPSAVPAKAPAAARLNPDEVKALESLAARQPGDASVRTELGNLYMDAERWNEAIRWYREALALDPARLDAALDFGTCLVNSGRPAEALAEFDRVLKADPGHRNALYNRGIALLHLGRPAEAVAAWEDLLKRYPDDPQVQGLRGRIEQVRATAGK
jgi:cytochrome c-type biogenesis protein CcmH/NrfG